MLVYQPTVYSLDCSMLESLFETIHTFIINELLSLKPDSPSTPEKTEKTEKSTNRHK